MSKKKYEEGGFQTRPYKSEFFFEYGACGEIVEPRSLRLIPFSSLVAAPPRYSAGPTSSRPKNSVTKGQTRSAR